MSEKNIIDTVINNILQDRELYGDSINWANWMSQLTLFTCLYCAQQHGKIVDISILENKTEVNAHERCKCKYVPLDEATEQMTTMRSIKVVVTEAPGRGDFKISSIDGMLDSLENECLPGTLGELIIIGHGEDGGKFEMGDRTERFDQMTDTQIERLYKLLFSNTCFFF